MTCEHLALHEPLLTGGYQALMRAPSAKQPRLTCRLQLEVEKSQEVEETLLLRFPGMLPTNGYSVKRLPCVKGCDEEMRVAVWTKTDQPQPNPEDFSRNG